MTDYLRRSSDWRNPAVASAYDELSFWSARFGALLFEHLELRRGITGLDVGCGTGFPLLELAHAHGSSCRFAGVDIWVDALDRAGQKLRVHGLQKVIVIGADAARLPFGDACFDLVTSNLGLNNFEDPRAALRECARVAKPGARLVLTTNLRGHMRELYAAYRETLQDLGLARCLGRLAENEDHRSTRESLAGLLEECGFRVTRAIESAFRMRYLDGSALLRHSLTRFGFLDGWRRAVESEDEESVFAALEAKLNAIARAKGEIATTVPMMYLETQRS